jgi:hypothetical protein
MAQELWQFDYAGLINTLVAVILFTAIYFRSEAIHRKHGHFTASYGIIGFVTIVEIALGYWLFSVARLYGPSVWLFLTPLFCYIMLLILYTRRDLIQYKKSVDSEPQL